MEKLDGESQAKLIERVKKENVERGYWPSDVIIRLEQFYKMPSDTKYFVRAVGSYASRYVKAEYPSGTTVIYPKYPISKGTEGYFRKEELESLGIKLPE